MPRGRGTHKTAFKDYTGRQFNHWTVIDRAEDRNGRTHWNCRCVCGTERVVSGIHLVLNNSKSCGCVRPRKDESPRFKHGMSDTITHKSWSSMMTRCRNANRPDAKLYSVKGIKVCERWHEFTAFLEDMGERPSINHSIGRIDGNRGYEPDNCKWQTAREQANNTTRNKFIELNGRTMTLAEWCRERNIDYSKVQWRLKRGWSPYRALK